MACAWHPPAARVPRQVRHGFEEPPDHFFRLRTGNQHLSAAADPQAPEIRPPHDPLHRLSRQHTPQMVLEAGQLAFVIPAIERVEEQP